MPFLLGEYVDGVLCHDGLLRNTWDIGYRGCCCELQRLDPRRLCTPITHTGGRWCNEQARLIERQSVHLGHSFGKSHLSRGDRYDQHGKWDDAQCVISGDLLM